jgi:hypothetical protein
MIMISCAYPGTTGMGKCVSIKRVSQGRDNDNHFRFGRGRIFISVTFTLHYRPHCPL